VNPRKRATIKDLLNDDWVMKGYAAPVKWNTQIKVIVLIVNGKLVKTSMGCIGVSKETVVNIEINWYTMWLRIKY